MGALAGRPGDAIYVLSADPGSIRELIGGACTITAAGRNPLDAMRLLRQTSRSAQSRVWLE